MNPFDWRGPQFLCFFILVSVVGLFLLYRVTRGLFSDAPLMPSPEGRKHLRDPYLLAYLRGGPLETLKTIAFSLNKRKLLNAAGDSVGATGSKDALRAVTHPLERAMLSTCTPLQPASTVMHDGRLEALVENYAQPLRDTGLVADDAEMRRRFPAFALIAGALAVLGVVKLFVAMQRGHSNVVFLVVLTVLVVWAAYKICNLRRTRAGDRALSDQRVLFERLKTRINRLAADGATDEAVIVAAAYGLAALPEIAYPFAAKLRKQLEPKNSNKKSNSSNCGSSCGSSCGGGGCGGGCGGCGS